MSEPQTDSRPTRTAYSKQVSRRLRLTEDLVSSLDSHENEIVVALGKVLSPFVEKGKRLELRTLVRALRGLIENRQDRLQKAAYLRHLEKGEDVFRRLEDAKDRVDKGANPGEKRGGEDGRRGVLLGGIVA